MKGLLLCLLGIFFFFNAAGSELKSVIDNSGKHNIPFTASIISLPGLNNKSMSVSVPLKKDKDLDQLYDLLNRMKRAIEIDKDSTETYLIRLEKFSETAKSEVAKSLADIYMAEIVFYGYDIYRYTDEERVYDCGDLTSISEWNNICINKFIKEKLLSSYKNLETLNEMPASMISDFLISEYGENDNVNYNAFVSDLIVSKAARFASYLFENDNILSLRYLTEQDVEDLFSGKPMAESESLRNTGYFYDMIKLYDRIAELDKNKGKREVQYSMYRLEKLNFLNDIFKSYRLSPKRNTAEKINNIYFSRIEKLYEEYKDSPLKVISATEKGISEYPLNLPFLSDYLSELNSRMEGRETGGDDPGSKFEKLIPEIERVINGDPNNKYLCGIKMILSQLYNSTIDVKVKNVYPAGTDIKLPVSYKNIISANIKVNNENDETVYDRTIDFTPQYAFCKKDTLITLPKLDYGRYKVSLKPQRHINPLIAEWTEEPTLSDPVNFTISSLLSTVQITDNEVIFYIANSETGKPVKDADVEIYQEIKEKRTGNESEKYELTQTVSTDNNGIARYIRKKESGNYIFYKPVKSKDRFQKVSKEYMSSNRNTKEKKDRYAILLDRAVYRPGQTINFKIIGATTDNGVQKPLASGKIDVKFANVSNGEIISGKTLIADEFGSAWSEFTIPMAVLNGEYKLYCADASVEFEIAEYKRPSFFFVANSEKPDYLWGERVDIKGDVKSYSGAPMPDTSIEYVIYYNTARRIRNENIIVEKGTVLSDKNGDFSFSFLADSPYSEFFRNNEAGFSISLTATNIAGETINQTIDLNVGDMSLAIKFNNLSGYERRNLNTPKNVSVAVLSNKTEITPEVLINNNNKTDKSCLLNIYEIDKATAAHIAKANITEAVADSLMQKEYKLLSSEDLTSNTSYLLKDKIRKAGCYIFEISTTVYGQTCKRRYIVTVIDSATSKLPVKGINYLISTDTKEVEYGKNAIIRFCSSLKDISLLVEVVGRESEPVFYTKNISDGFTELKIPYKKEYGERFKVILSFVKNQEFYMDNVIFNAPAENEKLDFKAVTFRDRIIPGNKETWSFVITRESQGVEAQVLASMYDASLDNFRKLNWKNPFEIIYNLPVTDFRKPYRYNSTITFRDDNDLQCYENNRIKNDGFKDFDIYQILINSKYDFSMPIVEEAGVPQMKMSGSLKNNRNKLNSVLTGKIAGIEITDNEIIGTRSDFSETAFFYPDLMTDKDGNFVVAFTAPESLTKWNFNMFAVTKEMNAGTYSSVITTYKNLMVRPLLPRFLYQGDKVILNSVISNMTSAVAEGEMTMEVFNPYNDSVIIRNTAPFSAEANSTVNVSFGFTAPEGYDLLGFRFVAENESNSDGEQSLLAILPPKALITETASINTRKGDNEIENKSFINSFRKNDGEENYRYTFEYCANPAWFAIKALPAVTTMQSKSVLEAVKALYSNTIASYIAKSDPKIKLAIKELTKVKDSENMLSSSLVKNQNLMDILLNQTPWVMNAKGEKENTEAISSLFNEKRIKQAQDDALFTLRSLQDDNGGMSFFRGGTGSLYQTLYMLQYMARLKHLGVIEYNEDVNMMLYDAVRYTDETLYDDFIKNGSKYKPGYSDLYWAYVRGFYRDIPFTGKSIEVFNNIVDAVKKEKTMSLHDMAVSSLFLRDLGFEEDADRFTRRLRSLSTTTKEKGMFWANNRGNNYDNESAISVHVIIMEALDKAGATKDEINNMKLWLLKEKQANIWANTPVTMDAIWGILMNGDNWLDTGDGVKIIIAGEDIPTSPLFGSVDAVYHGKEIVPELGKVSIEQNVDHPGFGALYWQYYQSYDKVKSASNEISVEKELYKLEISGGKENLIKTDNFEKGDVAVVRLIVKSDRNVSFVRLNDLRAACFEPVEQLSGYTYNKTNYYQETKDASTNFYFDYLPKGTFVLEYKMYCTFSGEFNDGIAKIQSLYIPQLSAHSKGGKIIINK